MHFRDGRNNHVQGKWLSKEFSVWVRWCAQVGDQTEPQKKRKDKEGRDWTLRDQAGKEKGRLA